MHIERCCTVVAFVVEGSPNLLWIDTEANRIALPLIQGNRSTALQHPPGGLPVAWIPTTRTARVSPSRGSLRATTSGCAPWQSRRRMQSRACNARPAHPSEGNTTPTRRIAWQVRGACPLHVTAEGALCGLPEGDGVEPAAG